MTFFSKQEIINALKRLGELADERGEHIKLVLMGGAAMVLAYEARMSTRDVDAMILSPRNMRVVRDLIKRVAREHGLPDDWLNDGAKGYLIGLSQGQVVFSARGIEVKIPSVAQLLAMKLSAWRDDVDVEDARRLLTELHGTQDQIWREVESYLVPGSELKAKYAFLDLWESIHGAN